MNKSDRARIARLYGVLNRFPFPNSIKSLGVEDVGRFYGRMRVFLPEFTQVLSHVTHADCPDFDVDDEIKELERMICAMREEKENVQIEN